jgi:electron-transferring-flavoprotein dehydrogenase
LAEREIIETDVVIVGAGPAGLGAAIRLKQLNPSLGVTVVEKAAEIGGHILSGAVMDPSGLAELIPDWRERGAPVGPAVTKDRFHVLGRRTDLVLPNFILPPLMQTHDGVITSLGDLVRWLGEQAQALGVDIFPMTAAVDVLTDGDGAITGIVTGDLGVDRHGNPKPGYAAGIGISAKYTLIAEGARGSLGKDLIRRFNLAASREQELRDRRGGGGPAGPRHGQYWRGTLMTNDRMWSCRPALHSGAPRSQ